MTCSLETLAGRRGAPAAETEWGGILSGQAVERLACGAALRRLVLDSDSVAIDLGRKQRLLSAPARRALEAHDQHCVWPGCDRPPRWCQSHHRREWSAGGGTAVKTSALLCGRHHHLRHEGGWQLLLQKDGEWKAIPPIPPTWLSNHPPPELSLPQRGPEPACSASSIDPKGCRLRTHIKPSWADTSVTSAGYD